jgi:hypothetical protein
MYIIYSTQKLSYPFTTHGELAISIYIHGHAKLKDARVKPHAKRGCLLQIIKVRFNKIERLTSSYKY